MRPNERGFTMLELIIALAIVGALLAVAFGGLRVALAAWQRGEDRAEAHQHVRGVAQALARVVAGAYPYTASRADAPDPMILFRGTANRLELVTQTPPGAFAVPIAFAAVSMVLAGGDRPGLVVRQRALPNRDPFTEGAIVVQDPTIKTLTLAYLDAAGTWREEWDGDPERTLPRAVRLSVGTETDGRAEALPPMTITLRVLTR
jgi:general secretion pathway protein J